MILSLRLSLTGASVMPAGIAVSIDLCLQICCLYPFNLISNWTPLNGSDQAVRISRCQRLPVHYAFSKLDKISRTPRWKRFNRRLSAAEVVKRCTQITLNGRGAFLSG